MSICKVWAIKESSKLIKEAEKAGKSHQNGLDKLVKELLKGNTNPGIGTKPVGMGISELRHSDGSRVYIRTRGDTIEILGKSNKGNQQKVIDEILKTF